MRSQDAMPKQTPCMVVAKNVISKRTIDKYFCIRTSMCPDFDQEDLKRSFPDKIFIDEPNKRDQKTKDVVYLTMGCNRLNLEKWEVSVMTKRAGVSMKKLFLVSVESGELTIESTRIARIE